MILYMCFAKFATRLSSSLVFNVNQTWKHSVPSNCPYTFAFAANSWNAELTCF